MAKRKAKPPANRNFGGASFFQTPELPFGQSERYQKATPPIVPTYLSGYTSLQIMAANGWGVNDLLENDSGDTFYATPAQGNDKARMAGERGVVGRWNDGPADLAVSLQVSHWRLVNRAK